jgi:hypothetical protein
MPLMQPTFAMRFLTSNIVILPDWECVILARDTNSGSHRLFSQGLELQIPESSLSFGG